MNDKMSKKDKAQVIESIIAIILAIAILSNTGPLMSLFLIVSISVITLSIVLIGKYLKNKLQNRLAFFIPHSILIISIFILSNLINHSNNSDGWTYLTILGAIFIILILSFPPYFFFEDGKDPKKNGEAN